MPSIHKILLVDDESSIHDFVKEQLITQGYEVVGVFDGVEAVNAIQKDYYDLILLDINLPKIDGIEVLRFVKERDPAIEVIMLTGLSDIKTAVDCMNIGAFYYITKPFLYADLSKIVEKALERKHLYIENQALRSRISRISTPGEIISKNPAFRKALDLAERVAPTDSTVLIQGASGTGKELVANLIQRKSARADKPFVILNCASLPDSLLESELFGHEKGAFTDAQSRKQGLVEIANNGTLFLDEIGEISHTIQPKLLRYLETGEFRRVGSNITIKTDVRIISATNKNLQEEVREGRFREDLFYRLNVITIQIPSLRERKEDIPVLVENFLNNRIHAHKKKNISPDAVKSLLRYEWLGNIRELENVLERAVLLANDDMITLNDLALPIERHCDDGGDDLESIFGAAHTIKEVEKLHLSAVLIKTGWDKATAARTLGISLKTLYTKIAKYNIQKT